MLARDCDSPGKRVVVFIRYDNQNPAWKIVAESHIGHRDPAGRDPCSNGSLFRTARSSPPARLAAPADPFEPHLCFAGEVFRSDHPATVHGAYQSGVAAANKLITALCREQVPSEAVGVIRFAHRLAATR